jgi:hypothetical protein
MTLVLLATLASAATCPWVTEPAKPDAPFLRATFRAGRELIFRPEADEQVVLQVNVTEAGTTPSRTFSPLGLLLADGSEVVVPMKPARRPDLYGASVRHHLAGTVTAWELSRAAETGIASLRFPSPGEAMPVLLTSSQAEKVARWARCAATGADATR